VVFITKMEFVVAKKTCYKELIIFILFCGHLINGVKFETDQVCQGLVSEQFQDHLSSFMRHEKHYSDNVLTDFCPFFLEGYRKHHYCQYETADEKTRAKRQITITDGFNDPNSDGLKDPILLFLNDYFNAMGTTSVWFVIDGIQRNYIKRIKFFSSKGISSGTSVIYANQEKNHFHLPLESHTAVVVLTQNNESIKLLKNVSSNFKDVIMYGGFRTLHNMFRSWLHMYPHTVIYLVSCTLDL
jgi:hypothetical protein